jgi:hypothetical protein
VNIGDWLLLPLIDATNVAVPAAIAVMLNDTLDEPTGMVAVVGTVATAGLLLDSAMLAPPASAAAVRVTVPCPTPPTMTLGALSVTPDTVDTAVAGAVGAVAAPPHCAAAMAATRTAAIGIAFRVISVPCREVEDQPADAADGCADARAFLPPATAPIAVPAPALPPMISASFSHDRLFACSGSGRRPPTPGEATI